MSCDISEVRKLTTVVVEEALEPRYNSDSDDEAIAGQEGDPAPTEPKPTPTSPAAIVSSIIRNSFQLDERPFLRQPAIQYERQP